MDKKEIFEKLCSIELELNPSTIRNYISNLSPNDIEELFSEVNEDGDKQYALNYNMRRALSSQSKKINTSMQHKILHVLKHLDNLSQNITQEESDKTSQSKKDYNDLDARLTVIKNMMSESNRITDDLTKKYTELDNKYNKIGKDLVNAQTALETSAADLQKASMQTENVINQAITILGIFVAIIAVFLGGFAGITVLDKISVFNTYKFYLTIVIVGHIMINLIFMFIYMLSRIIDKSVSVNCKNYIKRSDSDNDESIQDKCQTCCLNNMVSCRVCNDEYNTDYTTCTLFKRLKYKYPYVYFINVVGVIAEAGLCIGWLFDDVILYIKQFMSSNIVLTLFACIFLIVLIIWVYKNKT